MLSSNRVINNIIFSLVSRINFIQIDLHSFSFIRVYISWGLLERTINREKKREEEKCRCMNLLCILVSTFQYLNIIDGPY
jgi:hypothetical protein